MGNSPPAAPDVGNWGDLRTEKAREDANMSSDGEPPRLNPAAMPIADAAMVLTRLGGQEITEATLRADIDAGAPTNSDGTLNLVHYAAWLVKEMSNSGGGGGRGD